MASTHCTVEEVGCQNDLDCKDGRVCDSEARVCVDGDTEVEQGGGDEGGGEQGGHEGGQGGSEALCQDGGCDDGNACTNDSCDPAIGCVHADLVCDDQSACTTDSCDTATGCMFEAVVCDDSDVCTTDSCDPIGGCATAPVVCDDADPCTVDSCEQASGCVTAPLIVTGDIEIGFTGAQALWTVPACVSAITIDAAGAQGGDMPSAQTIGGAGARLVGDFAVAGGEMYAVFVGGRPLDNNGGGGASAVGGAFGTLIIAGGGGGAGDYSDGFEGVSGLLGGGTVDGQYCANSPMVAGMGGPAGNFYMFGFFSASGGGGLMGDGESGSSTSGGFAFVNGGQGGWSSNSALAGFGGGGGGCVAQSCMLNGGGGGGGYTGGAGGCYTGGGGGGSINNGQNQLNQDGVQLGDGKIVISW